MGFTWEQLNAFENPTASNLIRLAPHVTLLSVVLDPLIYFGVNPGLRKALRKLVFTDNTRHIIEAIELK